MRYNIKRKLIQTLSSRLSQDLKLDLQGPLPNTCTCPTSTTHSLGPKTQLLQQLHGPVHTGSRSAAGLWVVEHLDYSAHQLRAMHTHHVCPPRGPSEVLLHSGCLQGAPDEAVEELLPLSNLRGTISCSTRVPICNSSVHWQQPVGNL